MSSNNKTLHARGLCLKQAQTFIDSARHLDAQRWPHVVFHLSLLALEEVGKASMLSAKAVTHSNLDGTWIDRSLESHRRKLQWAIWSPMTRMDPNDFEAAREYAERAHSIRLSSLYVEANANLDDLSPSEQVLPSEAEDTLSLAERRLAFEKAQGTPSGELDEISKWFFDAISHPDRSKLLFSKPFIQEFENLRGDARAWATWAASEVARLEEENRQILEAELARPKVQKGLDKPRWRAKTIVYTPSHSLRPKVLARWNARIDTAQLQWSGKKDQFTLQVTLHDNEPLSELGGRLASLSKLVVACLNIGSIGYFWFEPPGFERAMFAEIRDLELGRNMELKGRDTFWDDGRAVALTSEHIDHAIHCLMAFAPLSSSEAEPIFAPYFHGLALIAKSDLFYNFDTLARHGFVRSLASAFRRYGNWSGKSDDFEASFHAEFESFMPDREHRNKMLKYLKSDGDLTETSLVNLRFAKQLTDLYLINVGRRNWRAAFDVQE